VVYVIKLKLVKNMQSSTSNSTSFVSEKLDPSFVTGFCDAESTFVISVYKRTQLKTGWHIRAVFQIGLNESDLPLLEKMQAFFKVGEISYHKKEKMVYFYVTKIQDLYTVIIPFFLNTH
jgi:hypothetical protein